MQKGFWWEARYVFMTLLGSALYAVSFNMFLHPQGINGGGVSGIAMLIVKLLGVGAVGLYMILINIPLFVVGYSKIGRRFFIGSLIGLLATSILIDVTEGLLPIVQTEPLLAAIYGGVLAGLGIGLVFSVGASTGGADIASRLIKRRLRNVQIGKIMLALDMVTVVLTGLVYRDINNALYSVVALYCSSKMIDMVVYGLDYSKVALIISDRYEEIANTIENQLSRGLTLLDGQGFYTKTEKKVILCAIKRQQLAELKEITNAIDPGAFIILQEAHQVLGSGFKHYDKNDL